MRFPKSLPGEARGDKWVVPIDDVEVFLSNLDKVFWPDEQRSSGARGARGAQRPRSDEGITKGDLLTYYFNIADVILPYVRDKPLAMKRMPHGVGGRYFFQRNAPDYTPDWVPLCAIEPADSKIDETVVIEKTADLLFVANLGCIELHPLHSRCERYDLPDYMVVDLDPMEPATFDDAIVIAQQVKVVLDHLGLVGCAKTSGATGVQIYVPVDEKHSYDETRGLAERIGMAIMDAARDLVTMEWDVDKRRGKVFIDHKMNRRAASLACAYSVRPQPGATVSTPLSWDEVSAGVDPERFTMATIFDRLEEVGDLFEPVMRQPQDLDDALAAMGVKASRRDISEGRVRERVSSGKRKRTRSA